MNKACPDVCVISKVGIKSVRMDSHIPAAYELFCPFQEIDENKLYLLEPEFERGVATEGYDDIDR